MGASTRRRSSILALPVGLFLWNPAAVIGAAIVIVFALLAVLGDLVTPYPPTAIFPEVLQSPGAQFWFGTDGNGMDVFSRVVAGSAWAFAVAAPVVLVGFVAGGCIGLLTGYWGGLFDEAVMRAMDTLRVFPVMILALAITAAVGPSLIVVILVIGLLDAPLFARVVRAEVLALRNSNLTDAAIAVGNPSWRVVFVHLLPNALTGATAQIGVRAAWAIRISATLSFLGVGIQPPTPEWGAMIRQGTEYFVTGQWWVGVFPGLALILLAFGFNLLGDGIQDHSRGGRNL